MKWSIVGLVFFGLVAAFSAAVLVASLRSNSRGDGGSVTILVASESLPRSKIIDSESVQEKSLPRKEVPEGALTNHVQVIGRVLVGPMAEGQVFKDDCFASQGSGYRVASVLPEGMRAMTLSLSDFGGLYGILYPGCYVDVLTSFRVPGAQGGQSCEAMSMPLLQAVQVLAVEEKTLVSEREEAEGKRSNTNRAKKLLVTLMVDLEQASALQLALQYGTVSLALRNPLDAVKVKKNQALLSKLSSGQMGFLKKLASQVQPSAMAEESPGAAPAGTPPAPGAIPAFLSGVEGLETDASGAPLSSDAGEATDPDFWRVTILRGNVITTQSLAVPEEGAK